MAISLPHQDQQSASAEVGFDTDVLSHAGIMEQGIRNAMRQMNAADPQYKILNSFCEFLQSNAGSITGNDISTVLTTGKEDGPLMRMGDGYDGVTILLSGSITVKFGKETIRRSGTGIYGEIAAITGTRTATVEPAGKITYVLITPRLWNRFLKEKALPELRALVLHRTPTVLDQVADSREQVGGLLQSNYPVGLEPTNAETNGKNALLFRALRDKIAPLYTKEALDGSEAEIAELGITDLNALIVYQSNLLLQIEEPDTVESNHAGWHEWGIFEHTRQVVNAIQHLDRIDHDGIAEGFLKELKEQEIDGISKYDLLLLSLTLHDLGKTRPIAKKSREGDIFPSHDGHEQRSKQLILRALENPTGTEADKSLHSLLIENLKLTKSQIKYIADLAGLHFEFGIVRREAGKKFNMKFMESEKFSGVCQAIFADPERSDYQREIGLLFLLDSAGKTPKESWKVNGVDTGGIPKDEEIDAMKPEWRSSVQKKYRPSLVDAYTSYQTSRAVALRYLQMLRERKAEMPA